MRVRLVFLIVLFIGSFISIGFACEPASTGDVCVNVNSLETFSSIQGAIDDPDTLAGHLLVVFLTSRVNFLSHCFVACLRFSV